MLVKFKVVYGNKYSYYSSDDKILNLLAMFLTDDVGNFSPSYYRNWALDPSPMGSGGNMSDLEKENGNVVLRYDEIFNDNTAFITTIENFVEILDTWEKLCKEKPKEILMTREDSEIALFGVNK